MRCWWMSLDGGSRIAVALESVALAGILYGLGSNLWGLVAS